MQVKEDDTHTYIFMMETSQDFYFPQCTLAVCLVIKWTNFFDSNFCSVMIIECRTTGDGMAYVS